MRNRTKQPRATWDDPKRPKPTIEHVRERARVRGWFLPQLQYIDAVLSKRWAYWIAILMKRSIGQLPEWSIPQIRFELQPSGNSQYAVNWTYKPEGLILETGTAESLRSDIVKIYSWIMRDGTSFGRIVDWYLWALGDPLITEYPELRGDAEITLYYRMDLLTRMMAHPSDWACYALSELVYTKGNMNAWFPTPNSLVQLMAELTIGNNKNEDTRLMSVNEPCCGTGIILLHASNYSLHLTGNDVDLLMVKLTKLQGYLYAPWMVYGDRSRIVEFEVKKLTDMFRRSVDFTPKKPKTKNVRARVRVRKRKKV